MTSLRRYFGFGVKIPDDDRRFVETLFSDIKPGTIIAYQTKEEGIKLAMLVSRVRKISLFVSLGTNDEPFFRVLRPACARSWIFKSEEELGL